MGRFPLIGNDTIVCEIKENSTKSPPPTYWDKGDIEPHCKRKDWFDGWETKTLLLERQIKKIHDKHNTQ